MTGVRTQSASLARGSTTNMAYHLFHLLIKACTLIFCTGCLTHPTLYLSSVLFSVFSLCCFSRFFSATCITFSLRGSVPEAFCPSISSHLPPLLCSLIYGCLRAYVAISSYILCLNPAFSFCINGHSSILSERSYPSFLSIENLFQGDVRGFFYCS